MDLLRIVEADRVLCFSSDYPHWDTDEATYVARHLPAEWHARVFRENALELFGWADAPSEPAAPPAAVEAR